ncbi:MAG: hypothetical protein ACK5IQ_06595 [Bacteroidales bacterium]
MKATILGIISICFFIQLAAAQNTGVYDTLPLIKILNDTVTTYGALHLQNKLDLSISGKTNSSNIEQSSHDMGIMNRSFLGDSKKTLTPYIGYYHSEEQRSTSGQLGNQPYNWDAYVGGKINISKNVSINMGQSIKSIISKGEGSNQPDFSISFGSIPFGK